MWLIDTRTLFLKSFIGKPPPYAILSHTWLPDNSEVTFADIQNENKTIRDKKAGFQKIRLTCDQAKGEGIEYAWVDTCCINKDSSAELSEAINSMFKWYGSAAICYAYLEDCPYEDFLHDSPDSLSTLKGCRWFSRGWTLQELIAPGNFGFFAPRGDGWVQIGKRESLSDSLEHITRVPREILLQRRPLNDFSVAARMSWAAGRRTTREEDIAYCLLGLFDVNMPLLYGEGTKAFIRLQEEIVSGERDDSLFAWRSTEAAAVEFPYRGLFASSPEEFVESSDIKKLHLAETDVDGTTSIIGNGRVSLSCGVDPTDDDTGAILRLNCYHEKPFYTQAIMGTKIGFNTYLRSNPSELIHVNNSFRTEHWASGGTRSPLGVLQNITIEKHVLAKTAITTENQVFDDDEILLSDLPNKFQIEGVHFCHSYRVYGLTGQSTSMHVWQGSIAQTVPVSKVIGNKMAFEVSIKKFCLNIVRQRAMVNGRFLVIFWIDPIPGSRLCTFHLDVKKVSMKGAAACLMSAKKPSKSNSRRELTFGELIVSVTSRRLVTGASRAIWARVTISVVELSSREAHLRHHRNGLYELLRPSLFIFSGCAFVYLLHSYLLPFFLKEISSDLVSAYVPDRMTVLSMAFFIFSYIYIWYYKDLYGGVVDLRM